jgi:hypothetical protein
MTGSHQQESCSTCDWRLDVFCHRYAPKPLVTTEKNPDVLLVTAVWPFVSNADWCGEWKAHPEMLE